MTESQRIIDWGKSIELTNGKEELAQELLDMFIKSLPDYRANIKKHFADNAQDKLHSQVHNLHGSACYVNVPSLRDAVYKLETAIKQNDANNDKIAELIEQVELQINKVIYVYENEIYKQ